MTMSAGRTQLAVLLCSTALFGLPLSNPVAAQTLQEAPSRRSAVVAFNIPAGPLGSALTLWADTAKLRLLAPSEVLRGLRTAGVSGSYAPEQALRQLLAGTPLSYRFANASTVSIVRSGAASAANAALPEDAIRLDTIDVQGQGLAATLQNDGLARDGYRVSTLSSVGPLGSMALKDTPYSISVIPRELLQNIQAQAPEDVLKINPTTRSATPQGSGWAPMISIRGFQTYDTAEDGLRRANSFATVLEDKERVEILSGLSGFLYGAASPAGMVNYVYKRPTFERLNSITIGTYGGAQKYVHGDFGGRIDEAGRMGYRLNVVRQSGNTSIDDQAIERGLISGAFDWQITDRLKLELNATYNRYRLEAPSAYWSYAAGVPRSPVPDASKNWSQPWIRDQFEKTRLAARVLYDITDNFKFRGGYSFEDYRRPTQDHTMNSVPAPGVYRQISIHSGPSRARYDAAQALFDASFDTGAIKHKVTFGYYMHADRNWTSDYSPNSGWLGPFSMAYPVRLPVPKVPANLMSSYYGGGSQNHNFVIGDQIDFTDQWSALVGLNYSRILSEDVDSTGLLTQPRYNEARVSPSASLLYKPLSWLTLYGTYVEGLEQGGIAPATALNYGTVMKPMVSKQKEVGVKAQVGGVLLTGALFEIEKAYELTNAANIYVQDGIQRHRGVEFTATGKVTEALTVIGGVTLLDTKIKGGAYDGLNPMNVAKVLAKLYAEYEVGAVPGLVLTGGVYHTGQQWANAVNRDRLPAYTTLDLGLRYTTEISGKPLTLRLNVNNVTDKSYFQNSYYLGAPRTIALSAQMKF
ncbi:MAG: TonB-dependent receptor [Rhizobiales bacterium]|nr:TonB-dependent receptor [Hyphomicrobiales bacterium]